MRLRRDRQQLRGHQYPSAKRRQVVDLPDNSSVSTALTAATQAIATATALTAAAQAIATATALIAAAQAVATVAAHTATFPALTTAAGARGSNRVPRCDGYWPSTEQWCFSKLCGLCTVECGLYGLCLVWPQTQVLMPQRVWHLRQLPRSRRGRRLHKCLYWR